MARPTVNCIVCGKIHGKRRTRQSPPFPSRLALMMAVLETTGKIDHSTASKVFRICKVKKVIRPMCNEHYMDSVSWLVQKACSAIDDPDLIREHMKKSLESYPYVTDVLPHDVLESLHGYVRKYDETLSISNRDIIMFMRQNIARYGWDALSGSIPSVPLSLKKKRRTSEHSVDNSNARKSARLEAISQQDTISPFHLAAPADSSPSHPAPKTRCIRRRYNTKKKRIESYLSDLQWDQYLRWRKRKTMGTSIQGLGTEGCSDESKATPPLEEKSVSVSTTGERKKAKPVEEKRIWYAVVPIKSVNARKTLEFFLADHGFDGFKVVKDLRDHPDLKANSLVNASQESPKNEPSLTSRNLICSCENTPSTSRDLHGHTDEKVSNGYDAMKITKDIHDHPYVDVTNTSDDVKITKDVSDHYDVKPNDMVNVLQQEQRIKKLSPSSQDSTCSVPSSVSPVNDSSEAVPLTSLFKEESAYYEEIPAADLINSMATDTAIASTSHSKDVQVINDDGVKVKKARAVKRRSVALSKEEGSNYTSAVTRIARDRSCALDTLNDKEFRRRFRMTRRTFTSLCAQFDDYVQRYRGNSSANRLNNASTAMKIGVTLEILAGFDYSLLYTLKPKSKANVPATLERELECGYPLLYAARPRTRVGLPPEFKEVLWSMLELSERRINWPSDAELRDISSRFYKMTGIADVVGCIDSTRLWILPADAPKKKGPQALSVHFVADDNMQFRWVLPSSGNEENDSWVFSQSELFSQLRNGTRKGVLIGDDSYPNESFLLTPSHMLSVRNPDLHQVQALYKAHGIVAIAIQRLRRQFAILDGIVKLPSNMIQNVIVLCTALYNMTNVEGEPPFTDDDDEEEAIEEGEEEDFSVTSEESLFEREEDSKNFL